MILSYDNALRRAVLTTTNYDPNYPIVNIHSIWKRIVYQSDVGIINVTITAVFNSNEIVRSFFLLNSNVYSTVMRFYNAGNSLLTTWSFGGMAYHGEAVICRKVVMELIAPTTLYAGGMFIGDSVYCKKTADQDLPMVSTDQPTFSSDSQVSGRHGSVTRGGTITIPFLSYAERQALEKAFIYCGNITPFYLDLWQDSHNAFKPLYGVFTSNLNVQHEPEGDTVSFEFKEVNKWQLQGVCT